MEALPYAAWEDVLSGVCLIATSAEVCSVPSAILAVTVIVVSNLRHRLLMLLRGSVAEAGANLPRHR